MDTPTGSFSRKSQDAAAISRLHIAMFTNVFLPSTNGVVTSVRAFHQGLTQAGHIVFTFAPHAREEYHDLLPFVFRYPSWELPLQSYPLTLPVSPFVDALLPCLKLDVIHTNHPALLGNVAANKSRSLDVPLVFTYHTLYREYSHYVRHLPPNLVKEFLEHWLLHFMRKCHHIVVPSDSIRLVLEESYGIGKRVSVVATGIDATRFGRLTRLEARIKLGLDPRETLVLSVGRLAREKNWDIVLEAFQTAVRDAEDVRLLVVGGGEERPNLEQVCRERNIAEKVSFIGMVDNSRMADYYAAADLFCFASVTETQGLVTLEAMASGLPIAAVDANGTRDVLTDGREGLMVACEAAALSRALRGLLQDPEKRHQMGHAGRVRAKDFDLRHQALLMEDVYHTAIEDYRGGYRVPVETEASPSRWGEFLSYFRTKD
ncbi:MAG: glycosyltransferase [Vulcanimicrobiota bacterium]